MHNTKQKKPHISPQINLIHGVIVSGLASSVIYRVLETRSDNPKTIRKVWRCQRGNEKPQVQQEQTTQWPKDTNGVMRSRPLWYLLAIVLSVLARLTASHYPFGIFWPLCCLFLLDLRLLITPLVYFGHCVVCSCWTCGFSLPLWYLLAIVLSVLVELAKQQTRQWPKYTKGVMRTRKTNKNRQHNGQKIPKG
jgi:hypothetical protein